MPSQTPNGGINIPKGADILEQIELNKTKLFLEGYKELCEKHNRILAPSLEIQFLPPEAIKSKEIKKDDNNTDTNSGKPSGGK